MASISRFSGLVPKYLRSEERRVGKRVDLGGRRIIKKKKKQGRWPASITTCRAIKVVHQQPQQTSWLHDFFAEPSIVLPLSCPCQLSFFFQAEDGIRDA